MTTKPDFNDVLQKALSEFDERKQAEKQRLENALTLWDAVQEPGDMPLSEALLKVVDAACGWAYHECREKPGDLEALDIVKRLIGKLKGGDDD
ncbi:MAG: hypothetical protein PHX74_11650 [Candidatus Sumerlaeales bacterium]|nr:hypothetical protein [Candidatus Sumerlaeales bacterium]